MFRLIKQDDNTQWIKKNKKRNEIWARIIIDA